MSNHVAWPSIKAFPSVWRSIRRMENDAPCKFRCKPKLHGTNAGVRISVDGKVTAQSRNRDLTIDNDNYGFAAWVDHNKERFSQIHKLWGIDRWGHDMVIFGEWAGNGIHDTDAVTKISHKIFFVFAIQLGQDVAIAPDILEAVCPDLDDLVIVPWHTIEDNEPFSIYVDFNDEVFTSNHLARVDKEVDKFSNRDPFIFEMFGIDAPGEGLVFYPVVCGNDGFIKKGPNAAMFKAKTEHHLSKKTKVATAFTPAPGVEEYAREMVSEARVKQAVDVVSQGEFDIKNMSAYLKWIGQDVAKEGKDLLEASGLERKDVNKRVNALAAMMLKDLGKKLI